MTSFERERELMVDRQLRRRGVRDPRTLAAMAKVPRHLFVPDRIREFAYRDSALPIEQEQTISQPYIVALMAETLELEPGDRVLEIGTGSGYSAAVLAELAGEVFTIERYADLADRASERLAEAGYDRVHVRCGDGTAGWPEEAPFDAITVAAGGPEVPRSLRNQLAPGGRLVIPVGPSPSIQHLLRVRRREDGGFEEEDLGAVRFVPLIGAEGWGEDLDRAALRGARSDAERLPDLIGAAGRPIESIEDDPADDILERAGEARVVLLGEATHGTAEFYRMRARITEALIEERGFRLVALEADWPDAARLDEYVRGKGNGHGPRWSTFTRFPIWMWRNREFAAFVEWLRGYNLGREPERRVAVCGLDLYSMYTSIERVLEFLDDRDPDSATVARERYGCLTPWQSDPAVYGRVALSHRYRSCERAVVSMLGDLLERQLESQEIDEALHDAIQNARLVASAERYYRAMYYGSVASWNLRDQHMFATLQVMLERLGPQARAVVWEHNSHIGDAGATEMAARGEINVGSLCRAHYGDAAYAIGFGTHRGTVAAARHWGGEMEPMELRPSMPGSYERLFHDSEVEALTLALRSNGSLVAALSEQRLQRAVGVVYRPESELASHYFSAVLPRQFDEYVWFDETTAVTPLEARVGERSWVSGARPGIGV
jgi:protein-L-isoaspartate(D-aspartate) O-methyltransferase